MEQMMEQLVRPVYNTETNLRQSRTDSQISLISASDQGHEEQRQQPNRMNGCTQVELVYTLQPESPKCESYESRQSFFVSVALIIIGTLFMISNGIQFQFGFGTAGHPMWGGVFFNFAGGLGIRAARNKLKRTINAFMAFSLIALFSAVVIFGFSVMEAIKLSTAFNESDSIPLALDILLVVLAIIGWILARRVCILAKYAVSSSATTTGAAPGQLVQVSLMKENQPAVVLKPAPSSSPECADYFSARPNGDQMQVAAAEPAYEPPKNVQVIPIDQEIAGHLMKKCLIDD